MIKMRMPKLTESLSAPLQTDTKPYLLKSVPVGNRERLKLIGGTVAVNQLVQHGDFDATSGWQATRGTITATGNTLSFAITELSTGATQNRIQRVDIAPAEGHKCLVACTVNSPRTSNVLARWTTGGSNIINSAITANTWTTYQAIGQVPSGTLTPCFAVSVLADRGFVVGDVIQWRNVQIIDLTQMFGTTIADYAYTLEQSTAGDGIAWLKSYGFFVEYYYPYDAGSLLSVKTSGHKTVGQNLAYRLISTSNIYNGGNLIPVFAGEKIYVYGEWTYTSSSTMWGAIYSTRSETNKNNNRISQLASFGSGVVKEFDISVDGYFGVAFNSGVNTYTVTKMMISKTLITTYEPYTEHVYPLDDDLELRGIPKLTDGNIVYDGDEYASDGTVTRKFGVRAYQAGDESDSTVITDMTNTVYPLVTPTTETADAYENPQIVETGGTESFIDGRTVEMPVGNVSEYCEAVQSVSIGMRMGKGLSVKMRMGGEL